MDRYFLACLTGRGSVDDASQRVVIAMLWHWRERAHVPRQNLALAIIACTDLALDVSADCLLLIRGMGGGHLRELDTIIRSGTEMACVHLATLICAPSFSQYHAQECWKALLRCMMDTRKETLLDDTVSSLHVKEWFEWLGCLRKIFDVRRGSGGSEHTILERRLHDWAQVLEERYLDVLSSLESELSTGLLVQAALRGWGSQTQVRTILDFFASEGERDRRHPLLEAIEEWRLEGCSIDEDRWATLAAKVSTTP
jgi:hypothetical protein